MCKKSGKVWLVGAGPGDAGLFTRKGEQVLRQADTVVFDRLVGDGVLSLIPEGAACIDVGKQGGRHPVPQHEINRILLEEALAGKRVVRLKGGDPFVFGRGGEELELLCENGIPFEIVPGITSAVSVPAYAGIPVTHRDFASSLHIITGHGKNDTDPSIPYKALAEAGGTLVFLMGVGAMESICTGLIGAGMRPDMPAAILERGTTARQRRVVSTLSGLPDDARLAEIHPPAIIVVGEVCSLAGRFHWAEDRPLGGVRIVVTRPRELASSLSERLRALGAEVLDLPSIQTVPLDNPDLDRALNGAGTYSWLALTSPSGVRILFETLQGTGRDIRSLAGLKIAAIGPSTARALREHGLCTDLVPERYYARSLGEALGERAARDGGRILILRAREGSPELTEELEKAGATYDDVALYETVYRAGNGDTVRGLLESGGIDYVAFTSASTVRGYVKTVGPEAARRAVAVCIGETTRREAEQNGIPAVMAESPTIDSMLDTFAALKSR